MNDRYDGYAGGDQQYELVGYDEYGQPVYRPVPQQPAQGYDGYDARQQQGYGYDPYATGRQEPARPYDTGSGPTVSPYDTGQQETVSPYDTGQHRTVSPYDTGQHETVSPYDTGRQEAVSPYDTGQQPAVPSYDSFDPFGTGAPRGGAAGTVRAPYDGQGPDAGTAGTGRQPRVAEQTARIPQQAGPPRQAGPAEDGAPGGDRDYRTEQFAFVEEQEAESEDVIDWLKFTENRTERREEAKRRARSRIVALVVVAALAVVGGAGYLWYAGKLPGTATASKPGASTPVAAQKRDVIVVHLHNTKGGGTSTALLVDNTTTKQGTTVLLPNSLALTDDDGSTTTLAKSVDNDGSSGTRDALDTVLGTNIQGTWRLDTPYLNNLVELVGNIEVTTNAAVPDPDAKKKGEDPLVKKGTDETLSGKMAVAYATYRAPGEAQNAQLERFGQVMQGVMRKLSSDKQAATTTVQTLAQILDPSLTDQDLGAFLAKLADLAKGGDYKTALLPVQTDGTLSASASSSVIKDVLGGTAKSPDAGSAVRVGIENATGVKTATSQARVVLVNGGYTFLDSGTSAAQSVSRITYADAARKADAVQVAKTLGLPTSSVTKGKASGNADVSVVLGQDYKITSTRTG
ncbi:LytR C-terminal domain-containing protein [Streptomyces sp. NPDC059618]|uniref:LytR C-terminal domain-containing protein n=1 Tax=Streptomyces sp. NPDC059618 TaxID=3346887 RepID=UPI0036B307E4